MLPSDPKERAKSIEFHLRMGFKLSGPEDKIVSRFTFKSALKKLYHWQHSSTECFSDLLFVLIGKADVNNLQRLNIAFPEYVLAYSVWYYSDDPDKLFENWEIDHD